MSTNPITVLLADDHELVREGLRAILEEADDIRVIAEASNGEDAVRLAGHLRPSIVLMDIKMPHLTGIEATLRIKADFPEVNVVMLTTFSDRDHVKNAIQAGATGFLLKDVAKDELHHAIRDAASGKPTLHPEAQRSLMERVSETSIPAIAADLTPRERDVLRSIARGRSNKEIARDLGLTEGTVKGYVSSMLVKLGVPDRTQAALFAVKHGLNES